MLLGSGLTEVYLMGVIGACTARKVLALGILVFFLCVVYLGSPVGTNWLGMSFAILEHPSSHQYPLLCLSHCLTRSCPSHKLGQDSPLKRCVCIINPPTNTRNPVNHSDLWGRLASLVNKGAHVCDSFYSLFFSGVGLSNYDCVCKHYEEALGASSGALLLWSHFYFPNRICQTYSFLFRQLTFHLSCSRNSSLWGLVILYLKYSWRKMLFTITFL